MSLFRNLFSSNDRSETVMFVDVSANSVAGAFARYEEGKVPAVLYTRRLPVEARSSEKREDAVIRALEMLATMLIEEGGPALTRATGNRHLDAILISIDAPWQKTSIRVERFEQKEDFVFTKDMLLKRDENAEASDEITDESVMGAILNGYETSNPYGKRAHRVAIFVLSSIINREFIARVRGAFANFKHMKRSLVIAGSSLRYQAVHGAFPHERDALVIDTTGPAASVALIRKNILVAGVGVEQPADSVAITAQGAIQGLTDLATRYPLPGTVFLVTRDPEHSSMPQALLDAGLEKLWLSDAPPKLIPVLVSHTTSLVRQATAATPDLPLILMAIFWREQTTGGGKQLVS